jgi:O-antigen/teichoic acid export membrane protein
MIERFFKTASVVCLFGGAMVLTFAAQILAFRALGIRAYGEFSVIYSLSAIVSVVGTAGFDVSSLRFFPNIAGDTRSSFFVLSMKKTALWSGIWSSCVFVIAGIIYNLHVIVIAFAIAGCFIWSFVRVLSSLLRALNRFNLSLMIDRYFRDGIIVALSALMIFLGISLTVQWAVFSVIVAGGLGIALAIPHFREHFRATLMADREQHKFWLNASMGVLAINVLELTFSRLEIFICSYFLGPEAAAILNIINTISNIVIIPSAALTIIAMPMFSKFYEERDGSNLSRLMIWYTALNVAAGAVVAIPIAIFPDMFLGFFGESAISSVKVSYIHATLAVKVAATLFSAASPLILMSGRVNGLIAAYFGILALKVVCLVLWLLDFGVAAGVWSVTGGTILLVLIQAVLAAIIIRDKRKNRHLPI